MIIDYLRYYDLETYLFEDVHRRFQIEGSLSAFDFFSIVIWKANRAKSKVARRLLVKAPEKVADLDVIVGDLTKALFEAETPRERLRILMEDWGFFLPMASAVLSVLWPDSFTVYDVRACDQLGQYHQLANWTRFDRIWRSYRQFRDAVLAAGPEGLSLRDTDRYLWGRSTALQLRDDIARRFIKTNEPA
jgi:hypothetical protein